MSEEDPLSIIPICISGTMHHFEDELVGMIRRRLPFSDPWNCDYYPALVRVSTCLCVDKGSIYYIICMMQSGDQLLLLPCPRIMGAR